MGRRGVLWGARVVINGRAVPESVFDELRRRWAEPHRDYHSSTHLVSGLSALRDLGGTAIEDLAFWCHDAVHTNTTPADERASAEVARELLAPHLAAGDVAEVCRLIMLTAGHVVEPGDDAGARLCDADLSGLGSQWPQYLVNVAGIRSELPEITDDQWRRGRSAFLRGYLAKDRFYATELGRHRWEEQARGNLARELAELTQTGAIG